MADVARNIRNNNPGNIRIGSNDWDGTIEGIDNEFVTFATPSMGVRAMVKTLYTYQDRHNLSNVREIISRWAPYGENDTGAYIDFVSKRMGIDPDKSIDLKIDTDITKKLVSAMIQKEGGNDATEYFKSHVEKGILLASTTVEPAAKIPATTPNTTQTSRQIPPGRERESAPRLNELADLVNTDTTDSERPQLNKDNAFFSASNFSTLQEIINAAEKNNIFWDNELDNYENYSYNIELFMVPKNDANEFNRYRLSTFETVIKGGWPGDDVDSITIAKTATSTEFNIENLTLENLGTGSGSVAKMVGVDNHLSFDIVQIGNTDLNDTLQTCANLMGYPSIATAVYFIKITYKGYDIDNPKNSTSLPLVKVVPFLLTSLNEISTTTSSTGTTTSLTGTAVNYLAATHTINTTKHDMTFAIKPTLNETLDSFITELNKSSFKGTSYNAESESNYVDSFNFVFSTDFKERFAESKVNNTLANKSAANNDIARRANGFNIAEQIGQTTAGISIAHLIYDICIQSSDVKNALLVKSPGFSYAVRIIPEVVIKEHNMVTNKTAYDVTYFITMHREIIIQDVVDQSIKISETRKLLSEVFDKGRCRKLYYYEYTGLNDQILDLTISLDRQLIKSYGAPGDELSWNRFLKGNTDLSKLLTAEQFSKYRELTGLTNKLNNKLKKQSTDLEQKNADLKIRQDKLFQRTRQSMIDREFNTVRSPDGAQDVMQRYQDIGDSYSSMAELQRLNPELFNEVQKANQADDLRSIGLAKSAIENANTIISNTKSSISNTNKSIVELENTTKERLGILINEKHLKKQNEFNKSIRSNLLKPLNNISLAEELGSDLLADINKLSDTEFSSMMDAISLNSITFERDVLSHFRNGTSVASFSSTDRSNVDLARSKFYESLDADLSMQRLSMTIKGDPFWVEYYVSEETKQEKFGTKNSLDDNKGHLSNVNGTNFLMLVVNKADGVDEFDNIKIDNLDIFLYMVKKIHSKFSGGQFTQTLECIRQPIPSNFKSTTFATGMVDGEGDNINSRANNNLFDFGPGGEFGGGVNRIGGGRGSDPSVFGDPSGPGGNDITGNGLTSPLSDSGVAEVGRGGSLDPRIVAENSFNRMSGALSTLATTISESSLPSADQASRLTSLMNEAQMASNFGSTSATTAVANVKSLMLDTFGTPEEASLILQELTDDGEIVSPELIAMLNTQVYDGETVTNPTGVDAAAVLEVMTEITNINNLNTSSVDEIALDVPEYMTPVVDTSIANTTPPTGIELSNSNMMLDGSLPLESTETYSDPGTIQVDTNLEQLESLDLPSEVVSGYKDALETRNGITVRKYIDSLPQDQAELLNSIDNPYTVKTLPYDAPTIATIAATPLKTPREAIMQARIEDAQTQMIAQAGGSYNNLSADEKRHYENLSDAYDAIDEAAQLDPIRNESKLLKINDELDKSIRIYNDILAGGDSEWSWNEKQAEIKQEEKDQAKDNVADLSIDSVQPGAKEVRVNADGTTSVILDSTLPTSPSEGYTLPINTIINSMDDTFVPTDAHIAQFEDAHLTLGKLTDRVEEVQIKIIRPDGTIIDGVGVSVRPDPALLEEYGFNSGVFTEGETVSEDDPRFTFMTRTDLNNIKQLVADKYPLVDLLNNLSEEEMSEETKATRIKIAIDPFIIIEGDEE
ncbi:hypothetical protein N9I00_00390 [bacterium]|nr:hypothetical protein [bacterium]